MKTFLTSFFILGLFLTGISQTSPSKLKDPNVLLKSEVMPHWKSCAEEANTIDRHKCTETQMAEWVARNIKYPELAKSNGLEGTVLLKVVIDEKGKVINPEYIYKAHPLLDAEAKRVVAGMPSLNPGLQDGKAVKVQFAIPVKFEIN